MTSRGAPATNVLRLLHGHPRRAFRTSARRLCKADSGIPADAPPRQPPSEAEALRDRLKLGTMPTRTRSSPTSPPPPRTDNTAGAASPEPSVAASDDSGNATPTSNAPVRTRGETSAAVPLGPKGQVVYGEEGYTEDTIDRAEKEARKLRKQVIANASGAHIKRWDDPNKDVADVEASEVSNIGTGKGPKPVWSYLDASPRGWWPTGDFLVGAPPDKYGNPPPANNLLSTSPNKVTRKGLTSTERSRELRDVWFARMGPVKRLLFAIGRRLTHKEREALKTVRNILAFIALIVFGMTFNLIYNTYDRRRKWDARGQIGGGVIDYKLYRIITDLETTQNKRGEEYNNWLREFWRTMPIPTDFYAELEMLWRECIKKGWIKLDDERREFITEPFEMKYIAPKHLATNFDKIVVAQETSKDWRPRPKKMHDAP